MKQVDEVEYKWVSVCPDCGEQSCDWDEWVDTLSGNHPIVDCLCGCEYEVKCVLLGNNC